MSVPKTEPGKRGSGPLERSSWPERMKPRVAAWLHAFWPERPEHFCRDNGCQLGYLAFVRKTYDERLAELTAERKRLQEIVATLRAYIAAPEGDGPLRYAEALALADSAASDEARPA